MIFMEIMIKNVSFMKFTPNFSKNYDKKEKFVMQYNFMINI